MALLVGHEHIMKLAEQHLTLLLIGTGIALIVVALYTDKSFKAHVVGYCMIP